MGLDVHTVELMDGSTPTRQDRVLVALIKGLANLSGATSAAVTTAVSGNFPASYMVDVECNQNVFITITSKTATGFNVVMTPLTGAAVAAGTFNVLVIA